MSKIFYLLIPILLLNGCTAIKDVKPWQKAKLAKDTMTFAGENGIWEAYKKHIYYSKEGSKGGGGVGGGGCGCN
jgi:hypothetical protein